MGAPKSAAQTQDAISAYSIETRANTLNMTLAHRSANSYSRPVGRSVAIAVVLALGAQSSAQTPSVPASQPLLQYLRDYQAAPRGVDRYALRPLLATVCGTHDIRTEIPREGLPLLFHLEDLDRAVAAGCGTLTLRDGTVVDTHFTIGNALDSKMPDDEQQLQSLVRYRFDILAGPDGGVP